MAGPLAAVERFFERLFERPAARLFQARIEPIHLERALERVMESERRIHARRTYVPSSFRVLLNEADLATFDGDRRALGQQLGEGLRGYARAHGYILLARPSVSIDASPVVREGDVRAFAESLKGFGEPVAPAIGPSPGGSASAGSAMPVGAPPSMSPEASSSTSPATPPAAAPAADAVDTGAGTAVFAAPRLNVPRATLAVRTPGQPMTRLAVRPGTIRLGRARDNDVILADDRVSRHHGQIGVRLGMLVYTDLGSTNGSYLNGSAVTEIALGPGDVLQLGRSTVTIESAP
jgi:hypothetical protein